MLRRHKPLSQFPASFSHYGNFILATPYSGGNTNWNFSSPTGTVTVTW